MPAEHRAYTVPQLAHHWQRRPASVRAEIRSGALRAFTVGGRIRISPEAIAEYELRNAVVPPAAAKRRARRAADWVEYY